MKNKEIVEEYQCSGCVSGPYEKCFKPIRPQLGIGCDKHCPGTTLFKMSTGMQRDFLGMPTGFSRLGKNNDLRIQIFENQKQQEAIWEYDKFNIPCWKHKNEKGHIIVKGLQPRISMMFIHVIIDGDFDSIKALEITKKDMEEMDR